MLISTEARQPLGLSSGRGFWQRIKNGDLTPLADVTPPKAIDTAGGVSQVQ